MNIKIVGFALVLAFALSACASTTDQDKQVMVEVAPSTAESAPATEPAASAAAAQVSETDGDDPDKLICKKMAKLGTRVKTNVCATKAEWEGVAKRGRESTEKLQRRPQQGRDEG